jgi:hypothetical protein
LIAFQTRIEDFTNTNQGLNADPLGYSPAWSICSTIIPSLIYTACYTILEHRSVYFLFIFISEVTVHFRKYASRIYGGWKIVDRRKAIFEGKNVEKFNKFSSFFNSNLCAQLEKPIVLLITKKSEVTNITTITEFYENNKNGYLISIPNLLSSFHPESSFRFPTVPDSSLSSRLFSLLSPLSFHEDLMPAYISR